MQEDWKKNVPHVIALAILIFALLIVATKSGIIRCTDLGKSYCDVYYSLLGRPEILLIRGDDGIGDPIALARMIEDNHKVPVRILEIDKLSAGMLKKYEVVIVEHARKIPTEKLRIIKEYVFNDMGRLVWVGDSGTVGESADQSCKDLKYKLQYEQKVGDDWQVNIQEKDTRICIKESEIIFGTNATVSEISDLKKQELIERAWNELEDFCKNAFQGELEDIRMTKGFECTTRSQNFRNVFIDWTNEQEFKEVINPWNRAEYTPLGGEKQPGINFGGEVLGISFIADGFAVAEFDQYSQSIIEIRDELSGAHAGFVACSRYISKKGCNPLSKQAIVESDLRNIVNAKNDMETQIASILSTLRSLEMQKQNKNDTSGALLVKDGITRIETKESELKSIKISTEGIPSSENLSTINNIVSITEGVKNELLVLRGSESDTTVLNQYNSMINDLDAKLKSINSKLSALQAHISDYNICISQEVGTLAGNLVKYTGNEEQLKSLIAYSSPLIDDTGIVIFIREATNEKGLKKEWKALHDNLEALDLVKVCGNETDVQNGFESAVKAIELAEEARKNIEPAKASKSLATLQLADQFHPLVQGISKSIDLKKEGYPVPFVLVYTTHRHTYTVTQLAITPAYMNIGKWPAISVKDPKFAMHAFGKGVVIYYAFPPETDEVFVNNLINFILY